MYTLTTTTPAASNGSYGIVSTRWDDTALWLCDSGSGPVWFPLIRCGYSSTDKRVLFPTQNDALTYVRRYLMKEHRGHVSVRFTG